MPLPHTTFPTPVADMADVYGLRLPPSKKSQPKASASSAAATSTASSSSKPSAPSTSSFSLARVFKRKERASPGVEASQSSADSSTIHRRASFDSQCTLTAAPSIPTSKGTSKDYEAAFGMLASSYGTGGGMPIQPAPTKAIKK